MSLNGEPSQEQNETVKPDDEKSEEKLEDDELKKIFLQTEENIEEKKTEEKCAEENVEVEGESSGEKEVFESQCKLCECGYNGSECQHLDFLFDNQVSDDRKQQYYLALQKHWNDWNMRNMSVQPLCRACGMHYQGFLKLGIHLREKCNSEDEETREGHLKLLKALRELIHGVRDDSVTYERQVELVEMFSCPNGMHRYQKLHLKGEERPAQVAEEQDTDNVSESDGKKISRHQKPFMKCLLCDQEFRQLSQHIQEIFWKSDEVRKDRTGRDYRGYVYHLRGYLGNLYDELIRNDLSKKVPYCPSCGIHYRMAKGLSKGLLYHLRSKHLHWEKTGNNEPPEGDIHIDLCKEITDKIVSFVSEEITAEDLQQFFLQRFFCHEGGVELDLGCCPDATKEEKVSRLKLESMQSGNPPNRRRERERGSGGRGRGGKMARFGNRGGGSTVHTECSLCATVFNGRNQLEADNALHSHLLDTLFAVRVGRGGQGYPTHRYWHQLAPNNLMVTCPLCSINCENLDSLAQHLAQVMYGGAVGFARESHHQLASSIAEQFVGHMNGVFSLRDLSGIIENILYRRVTVGGPGYSMSRNNFGR